VARYDSKSIELILTLRL